jgi:fructokinase
MVAISLGSDGALLASADGTVEVPAPRVDVADTIGAGDAFMGGLLRQLLELGLASRLVSGAPLTRPQLAEVGSFAAKVAALTVSRRGADPPSLAEVAAYEPRLSV